MGVCSLAQVQASVRKMSFCGLSFATSGLCDPMQVTLAPWTSVFSLVKGGIESRPAQELLWPKYSEDISLCSLPSLCPASGSPRSPVPSFTYLTFSLFFFFFAL